MFSTIIINIEQALSWFVDKFDGPLWDLATITLLGVGAFLR